MRAQLQQEIQKKEDRIQAALCQIRCEQARRAVRRIRCLQCAEDDGAYVWEVLDDDSNTPCIRCRMYDTECTVISSAPDSAGLSVNQERLTARDDGSQEDEDEDMEDEEDAWRKLSGPDAELWRANAVLTAVSSMLKAMDFHLQHLPSVAPLLASSSTALIATSPSNEGTADLNLADWSSVPQTQMRQSLEELKSEYGQYVDDMDKVDIPVFDIDSGLMEQAEEQTEKEKARA